MSLLEGRAFGKTNRNCVANRAHVAEVQNGTFEDISRLFADAYPSSGSVR